MVVLAAVDLDRAPERPIEVGYDIATSHRDRLMILYVVSERRSERRRSNPEALRETPRTGGLLNRTYEKARRRVTELVDATLGTTGGDHVVVKGLVGDAAGEIAATARDLDPRFVVVGGRHRSVARQALLGGVSRRVLREVDRPVVTVMEPTE